MIKVAILHYILPIIIFFFGAKFLRHVTKVFVKDKPYFFHKNQCFTWAYFLQRLADIFSKKIDKTSGSIFIFGFFFYFVSLFFIKASVSHSFFEALLIMCIIASCIMDVKTMAIDYFLSYSVLLLCVLTSGVLFKIPDFSDIGNNFYLLVILTFGFIFWFVCKILKKDLMGGADFDFFLGMILFFHGYSIFIFIFISGVFGILSKILINKIDKKQQRIKEFPFLPAISLAFYFSRVFIN